MGKYEFHVLDSDLFDEWDALVERSYEGTIFHTSFWMKTVHPESCIIGCFRAGKLVAGFTGAVCRGRLGYRYLGNPLLTPYGGPVFPERTGKKVSYTSNNKKILEEMIAYVTSSFANIEVKLSPWLMDIQPFIWHGFSNDTRYTYIMDIHDIDKTWQGMDSGSCRNDIKKAEKDGLRVAMGADFTTLMDLVSKSFARQDCSIDHFNTLAERLFPVLAERDCCRTFICTRAGEPVAGNVMIFDAKRVYYWLGGYDASRRHHGGAGLALWKAVEYASRERQLTEFDFEGSMVPAIERYFRKFGGDLRGYQAVTRNDYRGTLYHMLLKIYMRIKN